MCSSWHNIYVSLQLWSRWWEGDKWTYNWIRYSFNMWWKWFHCSSNLKWFGKKYTQVVYWQLLLFNRSCQAFMKQMIIGPSNVESKSFLSMSFTFQKKPKKTTGRECIKENQSKKFSSCKVVASHELHIQISLERNLLRDVRGLIMP